MSSAEKLYHCTSVIRFTAEIENWFPIEQLHRKKIYLFDFFSLCLPGMQVTEGPLLTQVMT